MAMHIAAIQMVSSADWQTNQSKAADLIAQAAQQGAELVVLPEYFACIGKEDTDKLALAETLGTGAIQDFLRQAAQQHGIWLVAAGVPIQAPHSKAKAHKVYNSALAYNPQGELVAHYQKIHLFAFSHEAESYDEARTQLAGNTPVAFKLPARDGHVWSVGLSICYDLRFPELYRQLQADLYLVPSAFAHRTGQAHWEVLLRARAIENLAYVCAPNQGGTHNGTRQTWGQTLIANPWGEMLAQQATNAGVVMACIDQTVQQKLRSQLPALQHRVL